MPDHHGAPTGATDIPLQSDYADDPSMMELIRFFVTELNAVIDSLDVDGVTSDRQALRRFANELSGAAGGYGFPTITSHAAELETLLASSDVTQGEVDARFDALVALCRRAATPDVGPDASECAGEVTDGDA